MLCIGLGIAEHMDACWAVCMGGCTDKAHCARSEIIGSAAVMWHALFNPDSMMHDIRFLDSGTVMSSTQDVQCSNRAFYSKLVA